VSKAAKVTKAVATKPSPAKAVAGTAAKKSAAKASTNAKAESKQVPSVAKGRAIAPGRQAEPAKATKAATSKATAAVKESSDATKPKETATTATKVPRSVKSAAKSVPATSPKGSPGPYASEDKFLEEQRKMLLEERETYLGQMTDLRAEAESLALEREPGDVQFDEESGEGGTVAVDRERDLTLAAQAQATIAQIDVALGAIADKTYGVCENCRQAIPKARLRALPYVRLCMACKSGGLHRR
jgi:DnaK suppressor protein